jgi:SH3-like domain-containing protein
MRIIYHTVFLLSCFLFVTGSALVAHAQSASQKELFNPTGLEIPRFASLKSNKVFTRKGPGKRFPIEWIYQRKDLPVEIVQEFDTWRKIKDEDGAESWVHQSLLTGKRTAVSKVDPYARLFKKSDVNSRIIGLVEHGAIVEIKGCLEEWCKVDVLNYEGWITKKDLWGIYESENFQ